MGVVADDSGFGTLQPSMAEEISFLPRRRCHVNSPTSHSLATILSLFANTNESSISRDSDVSSSCSFKSKWVPIDFHTSSISCPKVLNVLLGRRFSLRTGSSLNPPLCPVETNGCTCRKHFLESEFGFEDSGTCNDSGPSPVSVSEALKTCENSKPFPVTVSEATKTCNNSYPSSVFVSGAPETCTDSDSSLVSVDYPENRLLQFGNDAINKSRVETENPNSDKLNIMENPVSISNLDWILSFGSSSNVCDPSTATGMRAAFPRSDPSRVSIHFSENRLLQLVNHEIDDSRLEETLAPSLQNPVNGQTPDLVYNLDSIPNPRNCSKLSMVGVYSHDDPATATEIGTTCLGSVQLHESQNCDENSIVLSSGDDSVPSKAIIRATDNELGTNMRLNYAEKSMEETINISRLPKETSHTISQLGLSTGIDAEDPITREPRTTSDSKEISKLSNNLSCTINTVMVADLVGSTDQNKNVTLANSAVEGLRETMPTFSEMNLTTEHFKMLKGGEIEEGEISNECLDTGDFAHTFRDPPGGDENEMASTSIGNVSGPYVMGTFASKENCRGENLLVSKRKGKDSSKKPVQNELMEREKEVNRMGGDVEDLTVALSTPDLAQHMSMRVAIQVQETTSTGTNFKAPKKGKRVLTEERKAKKKEAKRRKRAKMNIELGVKRLRLLPVSKPRKVYDCWFYMGGRCQQGDKCKFSHDIIPLTKSQPCMHLANQHCLKGDDCPFDHDLSKYPCLSLPTQQCLKGDDCPFDHDLSKYPCRNYQSSGTCYRGDKCLFSHKLPLAEPNSEGASKVKKPKPKWPLVKTNIKKPVNAKAITATISSLSLPSKAQTAGKRLNPPAQAPEGINFLSFGKATLTDDANKQQQEDLPKVDFISSQALKSGGDDGNKNSRSGARKAVLQTLAFAAKYESELLMRRPFQGLLEADNSGCKGSSSDRLAVTSPSADMFKGGSNHASKILQEFLFGGAMN